MEHPSTIHTEQVLLHALKHHLPTLADFVREAYTQAAEQFMPAIKTLGASQFDLYTGAMSVQDIISHSLLQLRQEGICTRQTYGHWIDAHNGYATLSLPDGSGWTLRYIDHERFVHLHPSRYALHTTRIKANAMKTICCYMLTYGWQAAAPHITQLNEVRDSLLHLSPLKLLAADEEMMKVYRLLREALLQSKDLWP